MIAPVAVNPWVGLSPREAYQAGVQAGRFDARLEFAAQARAERARPAPYQSQTLRVLRLLTERPRLRSSEIARALDIPVPSASTRCSELRRLGRLRHIMPEGVWEVVT